MQVVAKSLLACVIICAAVALGCQSSAPPTTSGIQTDDIVVETRAGAASPSPTPNNAPETVLPTNDAPMPTQSPSTTGTAASTVSSAATPTPDISRVRERQVFRLPISNILVPDPVYADFGESSILQYEIFAGLTTFTSDDAEPVQLDMAVNHFISRNGLTHTFFLRQDLLFSDGSPVTASDFKWSWERALRTAAQVEVATQAEWVLAPILGSIDVLSGESSELAGVAAVDETTLTIELSAPRYDLTALLAHPAVAVLKRENVEGWTVDWSSRVAGEWSAAVSSLSAESLPVGTGPFQLTTFDEGTEVYIVERNNHYHGKLPQLDSVRFDARIQSQAFDHEDGIDAGIQQLFENGLVDVGGFAFESDPDDESATPFNLAPGASNSTTEVLVFNPSIPPFNNLDFRRALAASIDIETVAPDHASLKATGIVAPDSPGYSESSMPIEYDIEAAKSSMAVFREANPMTVDPIVWNYGFHGWFEAERASIAASWERELSLEINVHGASTDEYHRLRKENKLPIVFRAHQASYPHPRSSVIDFQVIFGESLESDEVDAVNAMVQAAASEPDPVIALELYAVVEQHLLDNALVVPLWENPGHGYQIHVQEWVHGYEEGRYGGSRCKNVWFDETYPGPG